MLKALVIYITTLLCFPLLLKSQPSLVVKKKPFAVNELIEYDVFYKWGLVYIDAGWVNFSI